MSQTMRMEVSCGSSEALVAVARTSAHTSGWISASESSVSKGQVPEIATGGVSRELGGRGVASVGCRAAPPPVQRTSGWALLQAERRCAKRQVGRVQAPRLKSLHTGALVPAALCEVVLPFDVEAEEDLAACGS